MPKKSGKKVRVQVPKRLLRGKGNFIEDIAAGWKKFQGWTHGPGKKVMNAGRGALDVFFPGAGRVAKGVTDLFGLGAYGGVKTNSLMASPVPSMHSTIDKGIRVCHSEYLGDINSSTTFAIAKYPINPGVASTFPWLSALASGFQKWEVNGLVFFLKSTSASALNSTNTAMGTIIGAMQYNVNAANPVDKAQMLQLVGARDGKPSEDQVYPLECAKDMTVFPVKLCRDAWDNGTDDLQKYDAANFYIAAVGSQAVATIGELYVSYDITLKEPKRPKIPTAAYLCTGVDGTHMFGTTQTQGYDNIGVTFSNSTITLPPGGKTFIIEFYLTQTSAATTLGALTFSNCALNTSLTSPGVFAPATGETATKVMERIVIDITDPGRTSTITWASSTLGTVTSNRVLVTNMSPYVAQNT